MSGNFQLNFYKFGKEMEWRFAVGKLWWVAFEVSRKESALFTETFQIHRVTYWIYYGPYSHSFPLFWYVRWYFSFLWVFESFNILMAHSLDAHGHKNWFSSCCFSRGSLFNLTLYVTCIIVLSIPCSMLTDRTRHTFQNYLENFQKRAISS